VTLVVSGSESNTSLSTTSSTVLSEGQHPPQQPSSFVNSVGYDLSMEHNKLLAKFQALRMQHAQASEYLDSLELENQDLKDQLLDVATAPEE
jgi:cell shape-determining protein MreC